MHKDSRITQIHTDITTGLVDRINKSSVVQCSTTIILIGTPFSCQRRSNAGTHPLITVRTRPAQRGCSSAVAEIVVGNDKLEFRTHTTYGWHVHFIDFAYPHMFELLDTAIQRALVAFREVFPDQDKCTICGNRR